MSKKYHADATPTIITNDLYLATFLHATGCTVSKVVHNERRRISFVFTGERVRDLREAYRIGPVQLDMNSFRESLITIRRLMDAELEQRSVSHEPTRKCEPACTAQ